ncbi:ISL3 family transposase [Streptomyces kaniharaensis]|uniref:ISL3 family transposase n=1 Tax=Streptomyces kaniharaensis TaxID=212423 RepID=A0A6N7L0C1_9ACTN|nr:ISL3 family transposase [Streptomyces kaniharaensis]MQS16008.1 ISL3 family transposase [Streptomyces kaniharaensis]MQS16431.1 ISL3 family transposase [Streptomyces kaniharaensis]MQS17137.1 ISL3 family transposase [Streptomyces kaniharaensis]
MSVVFSGLSALVIEGVADEGDLIRVTARTRDEPVPCPVCGTPTGQVHGFHGRRVADVPVDGRRVVVSVRLRRLVCPVLDCRRQTFREQVPGVVERYQRRTNRLADQLGSVVKELAGRAGARLSRVLACWISRSTALRVLMRRALPPPRVPRVLGVDDFALKRRHRYATVIIDAETGERIDVLPDRSGETLAAWLREHPGAEYVCRDGSGSYGEAIRQALPEAVQVSDRWHLWSNLCGKVLAEVRSHAACWATAVNPVRPGGVREQTTRERWQRVHDLLDKGVGLLECARRLDVALNTVKRYARMMEPTGDRRAPRYKPTLVDPYRDHLRTRRVEDPAVPVLQLFREIKELGYTGSLNLLYRYITQGRAEGDKPVTTPQRFARLLLTRPENLRDKDAALLRELTKACPEMTELSCLAGEFAKLLTPAKGNDAKLTDWITAVHTVDLPHLHSFANGLELDRAAVDAGLTTPYHNGRTEGVNTRTKRIMRQMHGRAGFTLLRHRILLQ